MNPHKWLGTGFDLSAHFLKDPSTLTRTLAIQPEYLKTEHGGGEYPIINYSEWSIPLGRRFRALRLWFLMRYYGIEGLQKMIANHVAWGERLAHMFDGDARFEQVSAPILSLFSIRLSADGNDKEGPLTRRLLEAVNRDGTTYLTQTLVDAVFAIRVQIGQFDTSWEDVELAYEAICRSADAVLSGQE